MVQASWVAPSPLRRQRPGGGWHLPQRRAAEVEGGLYAYGPAPRYEPPPPA
jgi:hypothetical protein